MEITYHKEGDYMIPDLTIEKEPKVILTKYGRDRLRFIKENKKGLYTELMMKQILSQHLKEIQETAQKRVSQIVKELAEKNKVNEELKAKNQILWVQEMNNFKNQAEEIVYNEIIYN